MQDLNETGETFWKKFEGELINNTGNVYRLKNLLGYGANGSVFLSMKLAEDQKEPKEVAVRLMRSQGIDLKKYSLTHKNVVPYHDSGETTIKDYQLFYLVMDLADAGSVATLSELSQGRLSSSQVKSIVKDVVEGLCFLHEKERNIVHGNIKPSNILRFKGKREGEYIYKISDFGLPKFRDNVYYKSPEHLSGQKTSMDSDIWALGVTIVKMLTGSYPFKAETDDDLKRKIKNGEYDLSKVPEEWLKTVKGCLRMDTGKGGLGRKNIPWTAGEILKELETSTSGKNVSQSKKDNSANRQSKTKNPPDRKPSKPQKNIASSTAQTTKNIWKSKFLILLVLTILLFFVFYNNRYFLPLYQADRLFDAGEKKEAIAKYQEVIGIKPDDQHSYSRLGVLKYLLGDYQGAIVSLDEAIRLNPNDAVAIYYRAKAIEQLKKSRSPKPSPTPVPPKPSPTPVPTTTPTPPPPPKPPELPTNPPELPTNPPELPTNPPELPTNPPELPTNPPELPTNPPELPTNPPELPTNPPELPTNPPELPTNPPELPTNPPELPTNPPESSSDCERNPASGKVSCPFN